MQYSSSNDFVLPWGPQRPHKHRRKHRKHLDHDYVQYVKYGVGIAAGIAVVGWIKRKIQSIPVVGVLTSPFLCLMPTVLLGSAVGAAVVYSTEEGDPQAVQKKVLPKVKKQLNAAHRQVAAAASDIGRNVQDIHAQHIAAAEMAAREGQGAFTRMASQLDAAAAEAEAQLAPAIERHVKLAKRQLDRHTVEYDNWVQQQQQQQQQRHKLSSSRLVLSGSSSGDA